MSYITTLQLEPSNGNEPLQVLYCDFNFSQSTDSSGKPVSVPQGGLINVIVETDGKDYLFDWMVSPRKQKSGTFIFYHSDSISRFKTVRFTDAYCVAYQETFDYLSGTPRSTRLTISPREIKMGDTVTFTNNWPNMLSGETA